jgi:hypothetical protein
LTAKILLLLDFVRSAAVLREKENRCSSVQQHTFDDRNTGFQAKLVSRNMCFQGLFSSDLELQRELPGTMYLYVVLSSVMCQRSVLDDVRNV